MTQKTQNIPCFRTMIADLVPEVMSDLNCSAKDATRILSSVEDYIYQALLQHGSFRLKGIGTITIQKSKKRKAPAHAPLERFIPKKPKDGPVETETVRVGIRSTAHMKGCMLTSLREAEASSK